MKGGLVTLIRRERPKICLAGRVRPSSPSGRDDYRGKSRVRCRVRQSSGLLYMWIAIKCYSRRGERNQSFPSVTPAFTSLLRSICSLGSFQFVLPDLQLSKPTDAKRSTMSCSCWSHMSCASHTILARGQQVSSDGTKGLTVYREFAIELKVGL